MEVERFPCTNVAQFEVGERHSAAAVAVFCQQNGATGTKDGSVVYHIMFDDGPIEELTGAQLEFLERMPSAS